MSLQRKEGKGTCRPSRKAQTVDLQNIEKEVAGRGRDTDSLIEVIYAGVSLPLEAARAGRRTRASWWARLGEWASGDDKGGTDEGSGSRECRRRSAPV